MKKSIIFQIIKKGAFQKEWCSWSQKRTSKERGEYDKFCVMRESKKEGSAPQKSAYGNIESLNNERYRFHNFNTTTNLNMQMFQYRSTNIKRIQSLIFITVHTLSSVATLDHKHDFVHDRRSA